MGTLLAIISFLFALNFWYIGYKLGNLPSVFGGIFNESIFFVIVGFFLFFLFNIGSRKDNLFLEDNSEEIEEYEEVEDEIIEEIEVENNKKIYIYHNILKNFLIKYLYLLGVIFLYVALYIFSSVLFGTNILFFLIFLSFIILFLSFFLHKNIVIFNIISTTVFCYFLFSHFFIFYSFIYNVDFILYYYFFSFIIFCFILFYSIKKSSIYENYFQEKFGIYSLVFSFFLFLLFIPLILAYIFYIFGYSFLYSYIFFGFFVSFGYFIINSFEKLPYVFRMFISSGALIYQFLLSFIIISLIIFGKNYFIITFLFLYILWFLYLYKVYYIKDAFFVASGISLFLMFYLFYFVFDIFKLNVFVVIFIFFVLFLSIYGVIFVLFKEKSRKNLIFLHLAILVIWGLCQSINIFMQNHNLLSLGIILFITAFYIFIGIYHTKTNGIEVLTK